MNQLSILFVDDDPMLLQAIARSVMFSCPEWDATFECSSRKAMTIVESTNFDVVVTDMRMPEYDGVELLNHVKAISPNTIRIILSGQSNLDNADKTPEGVHRVLRKPCQVDQLRLIVDDLIKRHCD